MPNPINQIEKASYKMLEGVVSQVAADALQEAINNLQTEIALIRADVKPIALEDMTQNTQFMDLRNDFNALALRVIDVDFLNLPLNSHFSGLESRVQTLEVNQQHVSSMNLLSNPQMINMEARLASVENAIALIRNHLSI